MTSEEIRQKFLKFFEERGHKIVPSSSLVPQNDDSVLFTTAGMQQFKPYYTGSKDAEKDFGSKNVASIQKCVRTSDIDEVGDATHLTFFEMLGNFSFGGYWKEAAIRYAYDFITAELGLQIDYVSVFKDDESGIPADEESRQIWGSIDSKLQIKDHSRADNFWGPTGDEGPCGPTTEIYINGVEIWNIVFNEYYKTKEGAFKPLEIKGIDTGMGLERLLVQVQQKDNVFETDLFNGEKTKEERIVGDHIRTALHMIEDGVTPSNAGRGYILRRLIRRAVRYADMLGIDPNQKQNEVMQAEVTKFRETLKDGLKEFEKGTDAFTLFSTYGFPYELTKELAKEKGIEMNDDEFEAKFKAHQDVSRAGAEQKFKGGLANTNEQTVKLHTAHHLLLAALQEVLGKEVKQKGSNITEERLRIDFSFPRKLTPDELKQVEAIVNQHIESKHAVVKRDMPLIEAESIGAEMEFGAKYPEVVSIYFIEDAKGNIISKEFCGGPHISNTGELGKFTILKEEAVSAGVRRIKAALRTE